MPLYNTHCPNCGTRKRFLTTSSSFDTVPPAQKTCKCGTELIRDGSGPSTSIKEVLDNGAMPKAVERFADIEDMMHERIANSDPNAGRKNYS